MINHVLMICTGNICRSPMAQALLVRRLSSRNLATKVESAGLHALVGHPADPLALDLMRERGLDLSKHRARQVSKDLLRASDLILTMEADQQRETESIDSTLRGRVHRLGKVGRFDVPDPYVRGRAAFEQALALIERGLNELEPVFWSRS